MSNLCKFGAEFRAEAVELMVSSGRPIAKVAPEIGVVEGTLGNWVRVWKEKHPDALAKALGPVEWAKYKALQSENGELKREIEFPGKVSAFFTAKQRRATTSFLSARRRAPSQSIGCAGNSRSLGLVLPLAATGSPGQGPAAS
jgi:transposase